jgi:hypothetical protein
MYGRSGFRLLAVLALVIGAILVGGVAYQVGLNAGAQVVATGSAPAVVPYYGHPFGFGFGFFGFLGTLLFIFLIFAVIRAIAFGGRGRGWGGPGGWSGGPGGQGWRGSPWESRAHDVFEEWHRKAHSGEAGPSSPAQPGGTGQPGQTGQA